MNIRKTIEQEIKRLLREADEVDPDDPSAAGLQGEKEPAQVTPSADSTPSSETQRTAGKRNKQIPPSVTPTEKGFSAQNPFDSVQELQAYYAKPENKKEQQEIAFYKTDKGGIVKAYVVDGNITETSSVQLKYPSPLDYADQQKLAKQSLTRRFGAKCEFASFVQNLIREKIKFDDPILVKKLSDGKMGFVTATAINYMINYATKAGIKTNVKPIAYNKQAYLNACKTDTVTMQEFQKLFYAVPAEEIKKVVQQAAAQPTAQQTDANDITLELSMIRQIIAKRLGILLKNPSDIKRVSDTIYTQYLPNEIYKSRMKPGGITTDEMFRIVDVVLDRFDADFPNALEDKPSATKQNTPTTGGPEVSPLGPSARGARGAGAPVPQQESKSLRGMILKEILAALK